jgi:hypothetical protein
MLLIETLDLSILVPSPEPQVTEEGDRNSRYQQANDNRNSSEFSHCASSVSTEQKISEQLINSLEVEGGQISELGQSRRFDRAPMTSDLPR